MVDKSAVSEKIRATIATQEPSWKNALSRAVADKLSPPTMQPQVMTVEPPPAEVAPVAPTEAELLAAKRKQVIDHFDRVNQQSLRAENGRIGHLVGAGVEQAFILDKPVDVDSVVHNNQRNEDDTIRSRYYVIFTQQGIRAVVLDKGVVEEGGALQLLEGKTFDDRYANGEASLRFQLGHHEDKFEDGTGGRPENYGVFENTGNPITYELAAGRQGLIVDQGTEFFRLGAEIWRTIEGPAAAKLIDNVPEDIVTQAVSLSVEAAKIKREQPPTLPQQESTLLDNIMAASQTFESRQSWFAVWSNVWYTLLNNWNRSPE